MAHPFHNELLLKRMGIDTHEEPIVYMRADCDVCRSEGFSAHSRVAVTTERSSIIATLNVVRDGLHVTRQSQPHAHDKAGDVP